MTPAEVLIYYKHLFSAFAFVLGAVVGSFLNVCIYRMPLNLSVNNPRRSFCPHCKQQIPWYRNLPLISWLALRGQCANCKAPISFRYFGVELLTALLFLAVWLKCWDEAQYLLALPYWILLSLLIVATFIDFDHFIIPDEITWGGTGAGIVASLLFPALMGEETLLRGLLWSGIGAATGYFTLRAVVELGKIAFGKKRIALAPAAPFTWKRDGDDADFQVGEDKMRWSDLFSRESDRLVLQCKKAEIAGKQHGETSLVFFYNRVLVAGETHELDHLDSLSGIATEVVIPREAMGLGDVKFIAAIGAFLGWKAVFFTIMAASVIGALVGVTTILLRKREWSAKIPFGPYLALGAVIWLFVGPQLVEWYLNLLAPKL
jgi:leader peptidase (prepilin peptidase)/N-methyltransferase